MGLIINSQSTWTKIEYWKSNQINQVNMIDKLGTEKLKHKSLFFTFELPDKLKTKIKLKQNQSKKLEIAHSSKHLKWNLIMLFNLLIWLFW